VYVFSSRISVPRRIDLKFENFMPNRDSSIYLSRIMELTKYSYSCLSVIPGPQGGICDLHSEVLIA